MLSPSKESDWGDSVTDNFKYSGLTTFFLGGGASVEGLTVVNGKCLCGTIHFQFKVKSKEFDVCHCGMCRRWSGGPGFGVTSVTDPIFNGIEYLKIMLKS